MSDIRSEAVPGGSGDFRGATRSQEKPSRGTSVFTTTSLEQPTGELLDPNSTESYVNFIQGTVLPSFGLVSYNHSRNEVVKQALANSEIREMFFGNGAPDIVMQMSEGIDYLSQLFHYRFHPADNSPDLNKIYRYATGQDDETAINPNDLSVDSLLVRTRSAIDKLVEHLRETEGGERPQLTGYSTMRWETFSRHFTRRDINLLPEGPEREEERRVMLERTGRIGHDIRNPMTTIKGYMQLLGRATKNGSDGSFYLDRIRAGWEILYNTCQRLSFELAPALGDTRVLGSEISGVLGSYLRNQLDVTFRESFPPLVFTPQEIPEVIGGITCRVPIEFLANLAAQMAQNLERVSQAMREDPKRQNDSLHVGIDVRREDGFLVLSVADDGLGFDEKLVGENKFGSHHGYDSQKKISSTGIAMEDLQRQLTDPSIGGKIVTSNVMVDTPIGPQKYGAIIECYLPIVS